jgi:hypothetical protein
MYAGHDHRGQYAEDRHDHDSDYAALHHRHYDLEREDDRLQAALREIDTQLSDLRRELQDALRRVGELEQQTPQARQVQLEADKAAADLAESGYDRHGRGCRCSYCDYDDEPEESPLARRDAYIGTWSCQEVTGRRPEGATGEDQ